MFPSTITFNCHLIYRSFFFFGFLGPNGLFLELGLCKEMFCDLLILYSIVLMLGLFWIFGTQMGYFLAVIILKTFLGFTPKAEKIFYSLLPLISTFVFDLSLGHFRLFGPKRVIFGSQGQVQKLFCGLLKLFNNFYFNVSFNRDSLF